MALNRALLWQRSESKRQVVSSKLAQEPPELPSVDHRQKERIEALYRALRRLRKDDRVLILLALEGLSYREIASIVEISESNVGVRLTRIKKQRHQFFNVRPAHEIR